MAEAFDFKKAGKKQKAFKTPMLGGKSKPKNTIGQNRGAKAFDAQGREYAESGLPVNSLIRAIGVLRKADKAGDVAKAVAAQSAGKRLAAKTIGQGAGNNRFLQEAGKMARSKSDKVFPRYDAARSGEFRGMTSREFTAMAGRKADIPMARKRELSEAVKQTSTGFTEFSKGAYKAVKFGPNPAYKAGAKEIARSKMAKGRGR